MTLHLRPFTGDDTEACLRLFDSNQPPYFLPQERQEFALFLRDPGLYWVMEQAGEVVGCGGVWQGDLRHPERRAGLSWGMVRRDLHGQRLGTLLLRHRLHALADLGEPHCWIDTSQYTAPYFARQGFAEVSRTPDGYGPGLDQVIMVRELNRLQADT